MRKQFFSFLILLSLFVSLSAQKAQPKVQIFDTNLVEQNLRKHVNYLASDKLEGRRTGEKGATFSAGYVANRFANSKLKAGFVKNGKASFLQPFPYKPRNEKGEILPEAKEAQAYNVIGILEGTDAVLKNEAIVIGAHYDHLGHGGMGSLAANSTEIHFGADDNASGTSALIELARTFAQTKANKHTIIFIAFGGEEEGLLGSKFYVNNPVFPLNKTVAMFNMDMIGRLKDDKLTVGGIGTANEWNELVKRKNEIYFDNNNGYGVGKKFDLQLNEDGFGPSDHSSFYGKQIPVLFFFTGTHLDYHKPSDTAEKINYAGLTKISSYVSDIVKTIDQNPTKPTYTLAKSSGTGEGRRGFSVSLGTIPSYSDGNDGLVLDGVRDNSPASKTGLKAGDKIIKLAGKDIRNVQDYTAVLGEMKPDVEYEVIVMRGSEKLALKITPATRK
ncbi:MAG TPA: M28 family peptidase [Pyrinomonadaceae bacterium]|nr:M28 family peptidase [Pyrinomonadaceae bacterium]